MQRLTKPSSSELHMDHTVLSLLKDAYILTAPMFL